VYKKSNNEDGKRMVMIDLRGQVAVYQNNKYGEGVRVFTQGKKSRCTICAEQG
jgi:hypothetical protein